MTESVFQEGIPNGFTPDFETGIFHDQRHLQLQSPSGWHTYTLLNPHEKTIVAEVHYHVEGETASSPLRSPYGSFVFSERIPMARLLEFISWTELKLKEKGVRTLLLKNPPEAYTNGSKLNQLLHQSGYSIYLEETSAVLQVDEKRYGEKLNRSKRGLLKKGYDNELRLQQLSADRIQEVYEFIKKCYAEKGYALSMPWESLQKVVRVFPQVFFPHAVFNGEQMVAACISIQVNPTVLYTFYYNHLKAYDFVSPIVFLCEGLYQFCQESNIQLLDLGTSNKGAELNESLINFKLSLGAQSSSKLTFIKKIS